MCQELLREPGRCYLHILHTTTKPWGRDHYPYVTGVWRGKTVWLVSDRADVSAPLCLISKPIFFLLYLIHLPLLTLRFSSWGIQLLRIWSTMNFQGRCVTINTSFLGGKKKLVSSKCHVFVPDVRWQWFKHQKWNYNCWKSERDHSKTLGKKRELSLSWQDPVISLGEISFLKSKTSELLSSKILVEAHILPSEVSETVLFLSWFLLLVWLDMLGKDWGRQSCGLFLLWLPPWGREESASPSQWQPLPTLLCTWSAMAGRRYQFVLKSSHLNKATNKYSINWQLPLAPMNHLSPSPFFSPPEQLINLNFI